MILEYRSVCGRSGIPFSRMESWRKNGICSAAFYESAALLAKR